MAAVPLIAGPLQEGAAKSQAADFNAYTAEENALQSLQQSAEQERQLRVSAYQQIGDARAGYGASGVSSTSGSALDVLQSSAQNAELDALNIKHAGQVKAWSYRTGKAMSVAEGANARMAGNYGAFNAILNMGNRAASGGFGGGGS